MIYGDAMVLAVSPSTSESVLLGRSLALAPNAVVRAEAFGGLAYHYGTRSLVLLKHADVRRVIEALASSRTVCDAFDACGVSVDRRPEFLRACASLLQAGILHDSAR
jgi:mycofactocin biosynthesis protein MftB